MPTVWGREINALIQEGEDIVRRIYAFDHGDKSIRLNLNEIIAWAGDIEVVARKLEIAIPSSEESLKFVIGWEATVPEQADRWPVVLLPPHPFPFLSASPS